MATAVAKGVIKNLLYFKACRNLGVAVAIATDSYMTRDLILKGGHFFVVAVFGMEPDMTREGGSIPVTLTLQNATQKNVMLLPMGACDDSAHSQNEKMDRSNYINGVSAT